MLRPPLTEVASDSVAEVKFHRTDSQNYADKSSDFRLPTKRDYQRQYFYLYRQRVAKLKPAILKTVEKDFAGVPVKPLAQLSEIKEEVIVVGRVNVERKYNS